MNYGLNYGLPFHQYLSVDAVSSSTLGGMKRSPAHVRYRRENDDEESDAQRVGSAVHCAILETKSFLDRYAKAPKCDRRTTIGKQTYQAFVESAFGKIPLPHNEYELVFNIAEAVKSHPAAGTLVANATTELSLMWRDDEFNVDCKARLDGWNENAQTILDIKTTQDASYDNFSSSIFKYGYYRQAAYYIHGAKQAGLKPLHFCFIAVEKEAPFGVAVYRLDEAAIERGLAEAKSLLQEYSICKHNDSWPCYSEEVQPIGLSDFNMSKLGELYG